MLLANASMFSWVLSAAHCWNSPDAAAAASNRGASLVLLAIVTAFSKILLQRPTRKADVHFLEVCICTISPRQAQVTKNHDKQGLQRDPPWLSPQSLRYRAYKLSGELNVSPYSTPNGVSASIRRDRVALSGRSSQ
uniref:Putative secreted protein n=1 Tax=Ixodes ricinus TaxID=34613 RepID=A0A6B0US77_IXORI